MTSVLMKPHCFLAPIITDFIRNTKRQVNDEKLENALEMLDFEWSKDNDTKTQVNRLNTSQLHWGNAFNKNGLARVIRRMQWEAPSKLLAVDDPLLLLEREVHAEIGINWGLDQDIQLQPEGGYVRILAESLLWEKRLVKTRIRTTEGLTTCMELHRGWTWWACLRARGRPLTTLPISWHVYPCKQMYMRTWVSSMYTQMHTHVHTCFHSYAYGRGYCHVKPALPAGRQSEADKQADKIQTQREKESVRKTEAERERESACVCVYVWVCVCVWEREY